MAIRATRPTSRRSTPARTTGRGAAARWRGALGSAVALLLATLCVAPLTGVRAGPGWEQDPRYEALKQREAKVLGGLLKAALKGDCRAQAWALADRLLAIDPEHDAAIEVSERWMPREIREGRAPKGSFLKKRDKQLEALGDQYFRFGEQLEAAGIDPLDYYPVNIVAHRYGSQAGPLVQALAQAGYAWLESFGDKEQAAVDRLLGEHRDAITFPSIWDDRYLRIRAAWPEAKTAGLAGMRFLTDLPFEAALGELRAAADLHAWLGSWTKGRRTRKRGQDDHPYELCLFREARTYAKIAPDLVSEREQERLGEHGRFPTGWGRALASMEHPHNAWIAPRAQWLGAAAPALARARFAPDAGMSVRGRGAWLLAGFGGAMEGFVLDADGGASIDPARCWLLAAAAALHDEGRLLPWDELLKLDRDKAEAIERVDLEAQVGGTPRAMVKVSVVEAQATALMVGLLKASDKRLHTKLAGLLSELFLRDSLPDIDKAMGWKAGRAIEEAERAMEAARAAGGGR